MPVRTVERDEQIHALHAQGQTLQQIAAVVGLTRERVRQVLVRFGGPTAAEVRAAASAARATDAAALVDRIRKDVQAHPASTPVQIASRLGVARHEVTRHLPVDLRPLVLTRAGFSDRTWSDEGVMKAVASAATFSYPLSAGEYDNLLRSGEVRGPSAARIIQLYGNWSAACRRAGVEATPPRRGDYQSKWTDEDMLAFVRDYLSSPGCRGTFGAYDPWRRSVRADAPSAALLRARLGSWSDIKRKALVP